MKVAILLVISFLIRFFRGPVLATGGTTIIEMWHTGPGYLVLPAS